MVADGILSSYFFDKETYVYADLPLWLRLGMREYVKEAALKGRRLAFKPSATENVLIGQADREGQILTLQQIMTTTYDNWPEDREKQGRYLAQVIRAVRFLLDGPGKKNRLLKDFFPRYMAATVEAAAEWDAMERERRKDKKIAETVEEEEEAARERASRGKRQRAFILEKVNKKVCDFSQRDWDKLNKQFVSWMLK
jgi:hypothetical protein